MDIKYGRRKSFDIQSVDVTEENMAEVAEWCGGTIVGEGKDRFVRVPDQNAQNQQQTKAFVGDIVVHHLDLKTFKKFSRKAFDKTFDEIDGPEVVEVKHVEFDRSAETGQFVTEEFAATNPATTVHEQVEFSRQQEQADGVDPKSLGSELPHDADPS